MLLLTGCASGFSRTVHAPREPIRFASLVVAPVRITGTENPGWRRFELGQRQVSVALETVGDRIAIYGPAQVRIARWDEPGWLGNTAVPVLTREAQNVDEALLIRSTAEQRQTSSSQEREDLQGARKGGLASQELVWLVTTELIHPSSRTVLLELHGSVTVDPFAPPKPEDEFDTAAAMTHLLEAMTREALTHATQWLKDGPSVPQRARVLLSPAVTAAQHDANEAQKDALQAEVWMQARARFLNPAIDDAMAAQLSRTPESLLVVDVEGLLPGERIVAIGDEPPLPEVLARKRLKGPVTVRAGKSGTERVVTLP